MSQQRINRGCPAPTLLEGRSHHMPSMRVHQRQPRLPPPVMRLSRSGPPLLPLPSGSLWRPAGGRSQCRSTYTVHCTQEFVTTCLKTLCIYTRATARCAFCIPHRNRSIQHPLPTRRLAASTAAQGYPRSRAPKPQPHFRRIPQSHGQRRATRHST